MWEKASSAHGGDTIQLGLPFMIRKREIDSAANPGETLVEMA